VSESRSLTDAEIVELGSLNFELWDSNKHYESLWRKTAIINWCKLSDWNTRFFHLMASLFFYRKKYFDYIVVIDTKFLDSLGIKSKVANLYNNSFNSNFRPRPFMEV